MSSNPTAPAPAQGNPTGGTGAAQAPTATTNPVTTAGGVMTRQQSRMIQALATGTTGGATTAAAPVNPTATAGTATATAPVVFAMAPARISVDILDYSTKAGKDQYYKATAPLSSKEDNFDCSPDGLANFLQLLKRRALEMGWEDTILLIPDDVKNLTGTSKNFLKYYGSHTMEHLTEVARLYHPNKNNRLTQESFQLWNCLMDSITKEARDKVTVKEDEYTIEGESCGILLLKIIISKASVDTNASTAAVRSQLATLDRYIKTIDDYDIGVFNHYVETLLSRLVSRRQQSQDLLINLFRAYKTVDDQEFHRYINQKESDFEESSQADVLTPEKLMSMALEKFTILKEVKGTWREMSAEQKQIVALNARLEKTKATSNKKENVKSNKRNDKKSGGKPKKTSGAKTRKALPWQTEAPKPGEPTTKTVDGREWHYCSKHKKWGSHKTSECKGLGLDTGSSQSKPSSESTSESNLKSKANPRLVQAKKATVRFSELAEESDEE